MTTQSTYSRFLELPAELRLMIYCYALTNSQPLLASVVSVNTDGGSIQVPKLYAQGEHHTRYTPETPQIPKAEFNQLRYVCRLLCQETRGLSLRYNNELVFMSERTECAFDLDCGLVLGEPRTASLARAICARFLETIPVNEQARIRQMTLIEGGAVKPLKYHVVSGKSWYEMGQLLTGGKHPVIHAFCRTNPRSKVVLRLDSRRANNDGDEVPPMTGYRYALQHAGLRMFLRGSSAVEAGVEEAMRGDSGFPDSRRYSMMWNWLQGAEWRVTRCMIPGIETNPDAERTFKGALLDNFRVTICRGYRLPSLLCEMKDEWYAATRRELEEGC